MKRLRFIAAPFAFACAAVVAMAQTGVPDAPASRPLSALLADLKSPDVARRVAAAEALIHSDGDDAAIVRPLLELFRDAAAEMRRRDPEFLDLIDILPGDDPRLDALRPLKAAAKAIAVRGGAARALGASEAPGSLDAVEFVRSLSGYGCHPPEICLAAQALGARSATPLRIETDCGRLQGAYRADDWRRCDAFPLDARTTRLVLLRCPECYGCDMVALDFRIDAVGRWWTTAAGTASAFGRFAAADVGGDAFVGMDLAESARRGELVGLLFLDVDASEFAAPFPADVAVRPTRVPHRALEALRATARDAAAPSALRRAAEAVVIATESGVLQAEPRTPGSGPVVEARTASVVVLAKLAGRFAPARDYALEALNSLAGTVAAVGDERDRRSLLAAADADWLADPTLVDAARKAADAGADVPAHVARWLRRPAGVSASRAAARRGAPTPRPWGAAAAGTWDFPPQAIGTNSGPARISAAAIRFDLDVERRLTDDALAYGQPVPTADAWATPDGGSLVELASNEDGQPTVLVHLRPDAEGRPTARLYLRDAANGPVSSGGPPDGWTVVLPHRRFYDDPVWTIALVPPTGDRAGPPPPTTVVRVRNPLLR